jgi:archaellum biogenesis ATPase FlaH
MNEPNAINQVIKSLGDAGRSQDSIDRMNRLERRRITPTTVIPKRHFLFSMFGKPCFPKGELVALTGKEKSGKTFVSSLLMSLCFCQELLGVKRNGGERLPVLWYDTEQSEESTLEILVERISRMCGLEGAEFPADMFNVFNVRAEPWRERLPLLEEAINACQPQLVVLDGIRDLVDDINDGVLAQDVIERLMHLASDCGCCIVCVLHQNKSVEDKTLRGWIGTELANKSFEVYECSKNSDRIFSCRQTRTRKYDISETLRFSVADDGLPRPCSFEELERIAREQAKERERMKKQFEAKEHKVLPSNAFNREYLDPDSTNTLVVNYRKLFTDIVPQNQAMADSEVCAKAMELANIKTQSLYSRLRAAAVKEQIIFLSTDNAGKEFLARDAGPLQGELPF